MCLDIRAVNGRAFGHRTGRCQCLDQFDPEAPVRPAIEAVVYGCRRPILRRAVAPPAPHFENMDYARDHPAIIHTTGTTLVPRQKRFNHRPLFIRQPKQVPHQLLQIADLQELNLICYLKSMRSMGFDPSRTQRDQVKGDDAYFCVYRPTGKGGERSRPGLYRQAVQGTG